MKLSELFLHWIKFRKMYYLRPKTTVWYGVGPCPEINVRYKFLLNILYFLVRFSMIVPKRSNMQEIYAKKAIQFSSFTVYYLMKEHALTHYSYCI